MKGVMTFLTLVTGLLLIGGCAGMKPKEPSALVNELEPSGELEPAPQPDPAEVGTVWHGLGGKYGNEVTRTELVTVEGEEYTFRGSSGCTYTHTAAYGGYRFTRSVRWKDCPSAGHRNITGKTGSLWPMTVGKQVKYEATGLTTTNSYGRWDADWSCEVTDQVRVEVKAGTFDTYKVVCESKWMQKAAYYSPRLETMVRSVQEPKRDSAASKFDWQLTEIERP